MHQFNYISSLRTNCTPSEGCVSETCCISKTEAGLPDSLSLGISLLSSSAAGMPADIRGTGIGCDWYYRYTHSDAVIRVLTSLSFTFAEKATNLLGGECCYRYVSTGAYSPPCPSGVVNQILWGASPFTAKSTAAFWEYFFASGNDPTADPSIEPIPHCCCPTPSTLPCSAGGYELLWTNGEAIIPQPLYGDAELFICISGDTQGIATVAVSIGVAQPCETDTTGGDCTYSSNACDYNHPDIGCGTSCLPQPSCHSPPTQGCALTGTGLTLSASVDLSEIDGDTVWSKVQAASLTSPFEYSLCSCAGGGCSGGWLIDEQVNCDITSNCIFLDSQDPEAHHNTTSGDSAPIDVDCIYSVGTVALALS